MNKQRTTLPRHKPNHYKSQSWANLREQVDELTHEKGQLRAYVDNLRANIRRLDGLIEEVGGCTFSCINTYDDLKNSLIGLKRQRDKLQSQLSTLRAELERKNEALRWASGEAKGRLPDWFHAAISDTITGWLNPTQAATLRAAADGLMESVTAGAEVDTPEMMEWIAARCVRVHGDNPNVDFIVTLQQRAKSIRKAIATYKAAREAV